MDISTAIKSLLAQKRKTGVELAAYLGINAQSIRNKLHRGTFTADELVKIAEFCEVTLAYIVDDGQRLTLNSKKNTD